MSKLSQNNGYRFKVAKSNAHIEEKQYTSPSDTRRKEIEQHTSTFLANGGRIQQIPYGVGADINVD